MKKKKHRRLTTFGKFFFGTIGVLIIAVVAIFFIPRTATLNYKKEVDGQLEDCTDKVKFLNFVGFKFPELEYTNYTFDSWRDESGRIIENTKWLGSKTINAQITPKTFKISYPEDVTNYVEGLPTTYTYGNAIDLSKYIPDRPGYEFVTWLDVDGKETTEISAGTSGDITIAALYKTGRFAIIYKNIEDAEMPENYVKIKEPNKQVSDLPTPTREGYTFEGWCLDEDLTETVETIDAYDNKDITLYAKWSENEVYYQPEEYVEQPPLEDWQIEEQRLQQFYAENGQTE